MTFAVSTFGVRVSVSIDWCRSYNRRTLWQSTPESQPVGKPLNCGVGRGIG